MNVLKIRQDAASPWQTIVALKGEKGDKGDFVGYILTDEDKDEIVALVIAALPSSEEVSY